MPRRVQLIVECDLHDEPVEGTGQVQTLTLGRKSVELDMCQKCEEKLAKILAPYLERGHRPGQLTGLAPSSTGRPTGLRYNVRFDPKLCTKCDTLFDRGQALAAHARFCDGTPLPYPCTVDGCKFAFAKQGGLDRHLEKGQHADKPGDQKGEVVSPTRIHPGKVVNATTSRRRSAKTA